jgi:transcriptional regulator with XRE-family HTH domain
MTEVTQPTPSQDEHRAIGELLLQARIDRGLTAREVSDLTRITPETLRRVEAGRFEQCGGDVYARGHIRAYAQAVGLDPEPLLALYGAVHLPPLTKRDLRRPRTAEPAPARGERPLGSARKDARQAATNRARAVLPTIVPGAVPSLVPMAGSAAPPDVPALRRPRREDYTDADSGSAARLVEPAAADDGAAVNEAPAAFLGGAKNAARRGPNWSLALLGAVGAVGLVAAVQLWPHDAHASAGPADAAVPQAHSAAPAPAKPAAPPATPSPAAPKAPVDLKITTKAAPVWIGVVNAAGQQLYWNVLDAGQTKEFTDATRLDVTVGNAAGVALQFNGKVLPVSGTDGQVVTTSFGPAGRL